MHSLSSLVVLALSFVSLAVAGPLHPTTHSSRLAKNPIASRQFHYPRALIDVCADVDLSLILGSDLGVLAHICLCLSAFPLNLDLDVDLQVLANALGKTDLDALLQKLVEEDGTQCTYPDHSSPICTSGNPCGFTCTDGFVQVGDECICPPPNTICNGKCGSYPNGCGSALPKAPAMVRRSIGSYNRRETPGSHSGGPLNVDAAGLNLGGSNPSGASVPDLGRLLSGSDLAGLVNRVLSSNGISGPTSGGSQPGGLDLDLNVDVAVRLGDALGSVGGLVEGILALVGQILDSLLGTGVTTRLNPSSTSSPTPTLPGQGVAIVVDIDLSGLLGTTLSDAVDQILDEVLSAVSEVLTEVLGLLGLDLDIVIVVNVNGGNGLKSKTVSVKN